MTLITKDITTVEELKTLVGQGDKAAVIYDVSTGDANGLDLELLINMDSSIAGMNASVAQVWTMAQDIADATVAAAAEELAGYVADASTAAAEAAASAEAFDTTHPEIEYYSRVVADGGTVRSKAFMQRVFEANKDLLADTELLYVPEAGMKVTDGKIEKLYNLVGTNDAVQATAENRFYAGNLIAENENANIKSLNGLGTQKLTYQAVSFGENDDWSFILVINKKSSDTYSYLSLSSDSLNNGIEFRPAGIAVYLSGTLIYFTGEPIKIGKNTIIEFSHIAGTSILKINGVSTIPIDPSIILAAVSFSQLGRICVSGYELEASISYFQVVSKALSAFDSSRLVDFLSTEFPAIETIPVGSQQVATSNLEATVFGGTSVPEVQNAAVSAEKVTNGGFDSGDSWTPAFGWSIGGGKANYNGSTNFSLLSQSIALSIGKPHRIEFDITGNTAKLAFVNSGGLDIISGNSTADYIVGHHVINGVANYSLSYIEAFNDLGLPCSIDNFSIKELGWSDAQTIYDARIAAGDTVLQANIAAAMWCRYDNSADNGAIYGKLYNGYAVTALAPYAPTGFHVPSELEWTQLSEYLGGNTVSGGKLKAKYGGFDNAFATNESGVSAIAAGYRTRAGAFSLLGQYGFYRTTNTEVVAVVRDSTTSFSVSSCATEEGFQVLLFSNTPHLTTDKYESGLFATDIASTPKSIRIPFGCKVTNIKCVTSTSVTAIEAKLFNYAGTELETLITGKACNATTKSFSVTADQTVSYTDNYVRVTGSGNGSTGMNIIVTIEPI